MGLLEKAFEYKKEINRKGKTTLIDTIKGPAETEFIDDDIPISMSEDIRKDISDDLFELPEDDDYSPLDALKGQKEKQSNLNNNHLWLEQGKNKNIEKSIYTEPDVPNPLSLEDEPILPKDIDDSINPADAMNKSGLLNNNELHGMDATPETGEEENEIFEVEPYIIPDDNDEADPDVNLPDKPLDLIDTEQNRTDDSAIEFKKKDYPASATIPDGKYQEHMTLYEICKEISRSETKKVLFEVVIFSIMGQTGASAASIMMLNQENDAWAVANSCGLKSGNINLSFEASSGILKNIKKDIIDIEIFKEDENYTDSYKELSSISARLLVPWYFKGKVLGILTLGDKITDDEYTDQEREFIQAICEASAIELNKINTTEKLKSENISSKTGLDFLQHIHNVQEKIISNNSIKNIKEIVKYEFEQLGIISFSVFIYNIMKDKYVPVITSENEDYYSGLAIDETNPFISFIKKNKANPRIENFNKLEIITEAFNEVQIKKMSVLWAYPFLVGGQVMGFTAVFHVKDNLLNEDNRNEADNNIEKLSTMILSNTMNILEIDPDENKYSDNIEKLFRKIDLEILNSKRLNIPLTLIIFSIKNYKRYGNIFGYLKAKELINDFAELIKNRMSETDFSARYDRNKILVVLPGKDKKFAAPFANTIMNEFMQGFKKNEMQLLITFLISEFPEDGDDLLSLIDNID